MIETARLILRAPIASDLAWQLAHLNTPAVMRYLGGVSSADQVAESFEANTSALDNGEPGFLTVVLKQSGEPIGKCGLTPIITPSAPPVLQGGLQVGWSLAETFWGLGLAGEAARAAIATGFDTFEQTQIWSQTSDSNLPSTRLMVRLGFERRPELDYVDPDYPAGDNPTTVYHMAQRAMVRAA